jgi:hypothetical protein
MIPLKWSPLNAIYGNPEKCGRFYLRSLDGNLKMNGDVSAEQNHSGIVDIFWKVQSFAVAEQITHLLN